MAGTVASSPFSQLHGTSLPSFSVSLHFILYFVLPSSFVCILLVAIHLFHTKAELSNE